MAQPMVEQYRLVILAMAGLAGLIATTVFGPDIGWQLWLLVPLVAILGLPHGCLDVAIAQKLRPLPSVWSMVGFIALYLLLAGLVLGLWLTVPGIALALFLGYSALHFAGDWRRFVPGIGTLPLGLAIVTIPAIAYTPETAAILTLLAPASWAERLAEAMALISLLMAPLAFVLLVYRRAPLATTAEFLGLMVMGLFTPPLVYFALYFCLAHSPKHLQECARELDLGWRGLISRALPIWAVTLVVAVSVVMLLPAPPEAATLQTIFIGLAALTVPHMLLVEALWRRTYRHQLQGS